MRAKLGAGAIFLSHILRSAPADPEDLWDFGTVRNVGRPGTIGRANPNPVQVSGPPLTWEYTKDGTAQRSTPVPTVNGNGTGTARRGSASDANSMASSITAKGDRLPAVPQDQQATVRDTPVSQRQAYREPSDEYDDYEDDHPPEDDLADTAMLDTVVLPAIASVRSMLYSINATKCSDYLSFSLGCRRRKRA